MTKWVQIGSWLAACTALACSSDADNSGSGRRIPAPGLGASGTTGGGSSGASGSGFAGLGDIGMPVQPSPGAGTMAPRPEPDAGECGAVSQTAQNTFQPADIIIGIDTSGSMDDEIGFVQQNINAFSQQIIASGIDVRVILIATEGMASAGGGFFGGGQQNAICVGPPLGSGMCPGDSNPPRYIHVNQEVGSNDVLDIFVSAYPSYAPQLRENAIKTFVSITDDDATDAPYNTADAFIAAVGTLDMNPSMWTNWRYSSIYCKTDCEFSAAVGAVHADLVTKTQGVGGDLCLQDFAPVFDELAAQVVDEVEIACDWTIPAAPDTETFDAGKTNVQLDLDGAVEQLGKAASADACADQNGWHYDDEATPTRVVACPATCARIQAAQSATVDILFGCETVTIIPG